MSHQPHRRLPALLLLVMLPAAMPASHALAQGTRYTLVGGDVAVYNLAGEMRVEAGTGASVIVEVSRHGADGAKLEVEQGPIRGRETLRVIYPADHVIYPAIGRDESQTTVRDDGTFEGGSGRRVIVSGTGSGLEASADLRVLVPAGKRVSVNLAVGHVSVSNVDGQLNVDASSANVDATGTRGSLSIDVGSGDVSVTDASGDLRVDTGSGDVVLTSIRDGDVGIDTGSGKVTATALGAETVKIETGSGDISLGVDASLRSFHAETGSGSVTVHAPASLSAAVDLETSSGEIRSDFDVAVTRREEDRLVGRIGSDAAGNGGGRISIETGSGDVRLLRK